MDIHPLGTPGDSPNESRATARHDRLNSAVAITIALLATFAGLCKVKDDNIVQAMQQAQADKLDHWAYYQARNLREEVAEATATELEAASQGQAAAAQSHYAPLVARYRALAADQAAKKTELQRSAEADQRTYDALNFRDDQFDLSDALTALAILAPRSDVADRQACPLRRCTGRHGAGRANGTRGVGGLAPSSRCDRAASVLRRVTSLASAVDPVAFVGVPVVLLVVTTVASFLPARRASGIDPVTALREERSSDAHLAPRAQSQRFSIIERAT